MSKRLREMRLSRARAARAEKPAAPPDPAHDLDAARKSVEDAAAVSAGIWLSYLFALFYIAIAAGAVTHKDLLLENPVKLPFLNVELPLVAFFLLAPILFIVSHAYTLVHFVMLGAKVGVFDAELGDAPETREGLRRQLPGNIFVQFLAGPRDIRKGGLGWLLKAIAWITLVIGPVLLLLLIQVQFLPYHLAWVTWVQRFAVLVDLIVLWLLWPAVLNSQSDIQWPRLWRHPVLTLASLVPIGIAFTAATFPGEWLDQTFNNWRANPANRVTSALQKTRTSVHNLLFAGEIDEVSRRRKSLFSNTLVVPGLDILEARKLDDPKKLDSVKHTLVLRGRHLERAIFDGADLRKADLEGAHLESASLRSVQLQGASLDNAKFLGANLSGANLRSATLNGAQLQGVPLDGAQLQGASLDGAQLQGASLHNANLQGATFVRARLGGAGLQMAQLQGALLANAQLQGTLLGNAQLQGASLYAAQLQGSWLGNAQLQGASLECAQLQGASLFYAQLQGASFARANLQGANFSGSKLGGTNMRGAVAWRTSFQGAVLSAVSAKGLEEKAMSKDEFATVKATIENEIPDFGLRQHVLTEHVEILNPDSFVPKTSVIKMLNKGPADEAAYQKALAHELKTLACSNSESAPWVVRGLMRTLDPLDVFPNLEIALLVPARIDDTGPMAPALISNILSPDCPVAATLSEQDKANLRQLAEADLSQLGKNDQEMESCQNERDQDADERDQDAE